MVDYPSKIIDLKESFDYYPTSSDLFHSSNPGEGVNFHSFLGWPFPANDVTNNLGLSEVGKIHRYFKEVRAFREKIYGKFSPELLYELPVIEFNHKKNPDLGMICISGTIFTDPQLPVTLFNDESMDGRFNSLDNFKVIFSKRTQEIIDSGGKIAF